MTDQQIHSAIIYMYSHFSLVRTISDKEKILYYRELLVSEKFFKTRWIPLVLPSPSFWAKPTALKGLNDRSTDTQRNHIHDDRKNTKMSTTCTYYREILTMRALRSNRTIEYYVLLSLRTIEKRKDWI